MQHMVIKLDEYPFHLTTTSIYTVYNVPGILPPTILCCLTSCSRLFTSSYFIISTIKHINQKIESNSSNHTHGCNWHIKCFYEFCLIPFKFFSSNPFLTIIVSTTALGFCRSKCNILEHVKDWLIFFPPFCVHDSQNQNRFPIVKQPLC